MMIRSVKMSSDPPCDLRPWLSYGLQQIRFTFVKQNVPIWCSYIQLDAGLSSARVL